MLLAFTLLLFAWAIAASASTPVTGPIAGSFPVYMGVTAGSGNAYTLASPSPSVPPFGLTNQTTVRAVVNFTNTGAATLNVNSTGAEPIETNTASGLAALVGGEVISGLEYDFLYNTTCTCYVVVNSPQSAVVSGNSSPTITASQWAVWTIVPVTSASQTITLPASSGVSSNGGILIQAIGVSVTLTPNSADAINGGTAGASVTLGAGALAVVTKTSSGNIGVVGEGSANPSATAGPTAVNGSSPSWMRADAAPAVQGATSSQEGLVEGDGSTLTISGSHVISCTTATTSQIGCVKPDGSTITVSGGVISASGAVSSVSNSDGTLTVSPTTGAVLASLNLGHADTWTAAQTFSGGLTSSGATDLTGTVTASGLSGGTCSSGIAINSSDGLVLTTCPGAGGTGAAIVPFQQPTYSPVNFSTGTLTTIPSGKITLDRVPALTNVDTLTGSAFALTGCSAGVTVTWYYTAANDTTGASATTIGSVTITADDTATRGTVTNSGPVAQDDWLMAAITADVGCTAINVSATARVHTEPTYPPNCGYLESSFITPCNTQLLAAF